MKNEYSILNNVNVDFSQYEIEEVSEIEKKRMMKKFIDYKNKKVFWSKRKIVAVVVAMLLAVNLGVYGVKVLAGVNSFTYNFDKWVPSNIGEKYTTQIGKNLEGKGTKLILNNFFADNSRVQINFNINKGQNEIIKNSSRLVPDVYINGKRVERNSDAVESSIGAINGNYYECKVIFVVHVKSIPLDNKENVKLVFSTLAKDCGVSPSDFTYSFVYDSTSYKKASKVIKVDKSIIIGENILSLGDVTVAPDRVLISGSSKGFSAWDTSKDVDYYYDIVDKNNNPYSLKEEIGNGAFFYRFPDDMDVSTIKIIPYTYNKINTDMTSVSSDGRTKYILKDKIIEVNLK